MSRRLYLVPLVILHLVMWFFLTLRIDALWFGHHEENGRWISTAARNYVVYGADELNYLVTTTAYPAPEAEVYRYVHHPPLIVWLVSLSADIYGRYDEASPYVAGTPYELAVRLIPIFSTMISLSAFFVLVRRLYHPRIALLALALYAFTPMTTYFGRMVNHEPLALAFLYLFIAVFINWMRRYTHTRSLALIALASLTMWSAWAGAFFFFTLGIVALIYGKRVHRMGIVVIGGVVAAITAIIPVYYVMAHDETIAKLEEAFQFRTSNRSQSRGSEPFTMGSFIVRQITHMLTAMGFSLVLLGAIGTSIVARLKNRFADSVVLAMLIAGLLYMLVFRNAFYIHDYYKIYLMPSFAIAAALLVQATFTLKRRLGWRRFARPLVVSIIIVSTVLSAVWLTILHGSGNNAFPSAIVAGLSERTQQDDLIYTNLVDAIPSFQYYAYRKILTAKTPTQALTLAQSEDYTDLWYLFCPADADDVIDTVFADMPYDLIAGQCRLMMLGQNQ